MDQYINYKMTTTLNYLWLKMNFCLPKMASNDAKGHRIFNFRNSLLDRILVELRNIDYYFNV